MSPGCRLSIGILFIVKGLSTFHSHTQGARLQRKKLCSGFWLLRMKPTFLPSSHALPAISYLLPVVALPSLLPK